MNRLAPWRFWVFVGVLILSAFALPEIFEGPERLMGSFDLAALAFATVLTPLFFGRVPEAQAMRDAARKNDANRLLLLLITGIVSAAVLVAVAYELSGAAKAVSHAVPPIPFAIVTLALAWLFSNLVYALHYAHIFYTSDTQGKDCAGLRFPGTDEPDYWDFVYFSFTLGMTFQTSDVELSTKQFRRVVTLHSIAAFVFNLGIIGFTINVLGAMGG
jgi:uncharacterized membrane protein